MESLNFSPNKIIARDNTHPFPPMGQANMRLQSSKTKIKMHHIVWALTRILSSIAEVHFDISKPGFVAACFGTNLVEKNILKDLIVTLSVLITMKDEL